MSNVVIACHQHVLACYRHITEAGTHGLTQNQLTAKLISAEQQQQQQQQQQLGWSGLVQPALESLLQEGAVQWAPSFDLEVLVSTKLIDRLATSFTGSIAVDSASASDFHSLAGLQAAGSHNGVNGADGGLNAESTEAAEAAGADAGGPESWGLIKPWLDDAGKLNQPFWSALTRRVFSVVMRNPGEALGILNTKLRQFFMQGLTLYTYSHHTSNNYINAYTSQKKLGLYRASLLSPDTCRFKLWLGLFSARVRRILIVSAPSDSCPCCAMQLHLLSHCTHLCIMTEPLHGVSPPLEGP